jgi:hypothetical protein
MTLRVRFFCTGAPGMIVGILEEKQEEEEDDEDDDDFPFRFAVAWCVCPDTAFALRF